MQNEPLTLFIELNNSEFVFAVGKNIEENEFNLIFVNSINNNINNIKNNFDEVYRIIKENIILIEEKLDFIFKEAILLFDNFDSSIINFSGFKKLNGSQLIKENITYILNSLKLKVSESEKEKKILHIFNSKNLLDKKNTDNIPIGLYGDFYSHELSFFLINNNDFKNVKTIFDKCNLKIKKIISKNFLEGIHLIENNENLDNFFKISINEKNSELVYFENSSFKFIQKFNFGSNIIINDISKIIGFDFESTQKIIGNLNLSDDEYLEKDFFINKNFRKIKKKLLLDVASARIQEISELLTFRNINILSFFKKKPKIFLMLKKQAHKELFSEKFKEILSNKNEIEVNLLEQVNLENYFNHASKLVQFGWKREAVPIIHEKKSLLARFFDLFFG